MTSLMNIPFKCVLDLIPETNEVIVKVLERPFTGKIKLPPSDFMKFEFEITKWKKTAEHPEDRVFHYETEENGVWSYDKEQKLIESRKTPDEKYKEKEFSYWLESECQKRGIA